MIIIFSIENDHSTNEVCNILISRNEEFIRINNYTFFNELNILRSSNTKLNTIFYRGQNILNKIKSVWYRREPEYLIEEESSIEIELLRNKYYELKSIRDYFISRLRDVYWLNHPQNASLNKLVVLDIAKEIGFNTPKWLVTNNIDHFKKKLLYERLITKPIYEVIGIKHGENHFLTRTTEIKSTSFNKIREISNSFIQVLIEKETEIRVVYLEENIYSMEIFSQRDKKTEIDFRNYDTEIPIRFAAHSLPVDLKVKIKKFMNKVDLNFGSIDFILTKENDYYFLEVNPVGQFGMTSTPNNYGIEYEVAENLIKARKIKD